MIIETLADIGTDVYFIKGTRIVKCSIDSINIEVSNNGTIKKYYRFANQLFSNLTENEVALTQQGLFDKIKIKE